MDFFQEKKKQKYLILASVGMVLIAAGVLSYGRFSDRDIIMPDIEINQYRKPIINWAALESPELKELQIP
jgi:hypothetical protein